MLLTDFSVTAFLPFTYFIHSLACFVISSGGEVVSISNSCSGSDDDNSSGTCCREPEKEKTLTVAGKF